MQKHCLLFNLQQVSGLEVEVLCQMLMKPGLLGPWLELASQELTDNLHPHPL